MKKSIYTIAREKENIIKKYGSDAAQTENAKNYINDNMTIKGIYKVSTEKINPYKIVDILRNKKGVTWACINAINKNYAVIEVR